MIDTAKLTRLTRATFAFDPSSMHREDEMTPGPRGTSGPNPNASEELAALIRSCRQRLNPDTIPGLDAHQNSARRPRRRTVSQELVASLVGYSTAWYSSLERGEPKTYSADFLDRVVDILQMTSDERRLLFWLATGHEPTSPRLPSTVGTAPTFRRVLDAQPWPAYITDPAWDVLAYNSIAREWFPWVDGNETNVMRWVFTYPEARTQLHQWRTDWAPKMLGQLRAARARFPDNKRLEQVLTEILHSNRDARKIWDQPLTYLHPDGDQRALYLPHHRAATRIDIVGLEPMRAPGTRLMLLIPTDDHQPA
jgi:transcriptional regulator with XRE-family HTH domain